MYLFLLAKCESEMVHFFFKSKELSKRKEKRKKKKRKEKEIHNLNQIIRKIITPKNIWALELSVVQKTAEGNI